MRRKEFWSFVYVRGLVNFILLEPPTYSAGNLIVSAAGEKTVIQFNQGVRSKARSVRSTEAILRRMPSPSAI
jgi:hypothetical protein